MGGLIATVLDNYAKTQDRLWSHDRSQTVGASEVGQCARKVFWIKNEGDRQYGAPRDPDHKDTWGARMRGSVYENEVWYPALKAHFGETLHFAGPHQQTFVSGFLSATPDGMVATDNDCFMCECKTADPRTNLTEAKAENVFQTHVQMGIVRELTQFKPTRSLLSYTDASFWNEVTEFTIPFDAKVYEHAKVRAATIMTATEPSELKPEGWIAGGRECEYCPFTKACGIQRRSVPESDAKPDPQFAAEMADLASAAKKWELARDEADIKVRELQQDIRDRLRNKGIRKVPGIVNWSYVKGRVGYDNRAIREAAQASGIDIEQFSTVGEATDRLTISVIPTEKLQAHA